MKILLGICPSGDSTCPCRHHIPSCVWAGSQQDILSDPEVAPELNLPNPWKDINICKRYLIHVILPAAVSAPQSDPGTVWWAGWPGPACISCSRPPTSGPSPRRPPASSCRVRPLGPGWGPRSGWTWQLVTADSWADLTAVLHSLITGDSCHCRPEQCYIVIWTVSGLSLQINCWVFVSLSIL